MEHHTTHPRVRDRLRTLLLERSVRFGKFTLSAGGETDVYVDVKPTTLHPEGIWDIVTLWDDMLSTQSSPLEFDAVGGLTLGADPLATALSLRLSFAGHWMNWNKNHEAKATPIDSSKIIPAFIVRKEPKKHGTARFIEGIENLAPGARVLVVEDVATTGASALRAIERARAEGLHPVGVIAVVDREQGAAEAFAHEGLPFWSIFTLSELRETQMSNSKL